MAERNSIIETLNTAFKDLPYALAMWQGGSAAFNRNDEWSDIDLVLIVEDGAQQQAMSLAELTLQSNFGIDTSFEIEPPAWPDMVQTFFRLKNTSPFLLVDFAILPVSAHSKFLEPEIHGSAVALFDKQNILSVAPLNQQALRQTLRARVILQRKRFDIFWVLAEKELHRNKEVDAFIFYWSYTLAPLIEMLRITYCPHHWNFGSRYLKEHLPAEVYSQLKPLFFVTGTNDLAEKNQQARQWFSSAAAQAAESLVLMD